SSARGMVRGGRRPGGDATSRSRFREASGSTRRGTGGRMQLIAKIARRQPLDLLEDPVELRERLEAGLEGRLADALVRIQQKVLHLFDPDPRQVIGKGQAGCLFEHLAEIEGAGVDRARHLLE